MSTMNPENLSASDLLKRAMPAHVSNEAILDKLVHELADPGNGKVLHLPGNPKVLSITGPSDREIQLRLVKALRVTMQTMRLLFLAIETLQPPVTDTPPPPGTTP